MRFSLNIYLVISITFLILHVGRGKNAGNSDGNSLRKPTSYSAEQRNKSKPRKRRAKKKHRVSTKNLNVKENDANGGNSHFQHILWVDIKQDKEADASNVINNDKMYIEFKYGSKEFKSGFPLTKFCDNVKSQQAYLEAQVNEIIRLSKAGGGLPLRCVLKMKRRGLSDETIGSAKFAHKRLKHNKDKLSIIKASLTDWKGCRTGVYLEIGMVQKLWPNDREKQKDLSKGSRSKEYIDNFFWCMAGFFAKSAKASKNLKASEMKQPVDRANPNLEMLVELGGLTKFPKHGEFVKVDRFTRGMFIGLNCLPFDDRVTNYSNRKDGITRIRNLLGDLVLEPREGYWETETEDDQMTRVFFSSIGMFFIEKIPGFEKGYVSDLTNLCKYECRDNKDYEPFGCKTFFDEDGRIVKIEEANGQQYFPPKNSAIANQEEKNYWEWAKLKSRTSAFVMAAFVHVAEYHYVWGNVPSSALRMFLSPQHPIRRALTVHFYKTHYTCARAKYSLFDKNGILSRGLSMKYESGLEQAFKDIISGFKFSVFSEDIENRGLSDCNFHVGAKDGVDLHKIIVKYVSDTFDEIYPHKEDLKNDKEMEKAYQYLKDNMGGIPKPYNMKNLKKVWGEIIFRVTGYHSAIGQVSAFALDPCMVNIRLRRKEVESLVTAEEGAIAVALITAITTVPCPKIGDDWKQALDNPNSKAYTKLRKSLKEQKKKVDNWNEIRPKNIDFHPNYCALSISS